MENNKSIEILKTAILMEKRGKAFYETVASATASEDVKKIFTIMAEEEQHHIDFLSKQFNDFTRTGSFQPLKYEGDESTVDNILTPDIQDQISAAGYEAAAISAAIDMENKAIQVYGDQAKNATDPNEKELYSWLSDWEKSHLKLLHNLNEQLKESIWNDNHFWPF